MIDGELGLSLKDVKAGYGHGDVLRGLSLDVPSGQITCLIGPNGCGKSTVLRVVSGLLRPREGQVVHSGEDVTGATPREMLERGVAQVPQERSLFPAMSVWDNLLLGAYINPDKEAVRVRANEIAERFPLVGKKLGDLAGSLSGGEQKTVEIARALMLDPQVLCFDEPSIGLEPRIRKSVFDTIADLSKEGRTVLLVEQNARSGLSIAHHGAVLHSGMVQLREPAHELLDNAEVARLYLGAS